MILRLNQVELRLVRVVVVGDVLVAHVDFRGDFLVDHLFYRQRTAQVALEVGRGKLLFFQSLVELLLRVRRFDLTVLAVHFLIRGQQAKLLSTPHKNFVVDQFMQNIKAERGGLFSRGCILGG